MSDKKMKVSIVIPVYNAEKYIEKCLDSLLGQTMEDLEIICVDDGSKDTSLSILNEYKKKDGRIQVITQQNQYAGAARNRGMKASSGDYILFFDADDFCEDNLLELVCKKMDETRADICIFNADQYNEKQKRYEAWKKMMANYTPKKDVFSKKELREFIFLFLYECPWDRLYRRDFLVKNQLEFQEILHANDVYFSCICLAMAERITILESQPLYHYRVGMETNLQSNKSKNPVCYLEAFHLLESKLTEYHVDTPKIMASLANTVIRSTASHFDSFSDNELCQEQIYNYYSEHFADTLKKYESQLFPNFFLIYEEIFAERGNRTMKELYEDYRNVRKESYSRNGKIKGIRMAVKKHGVSYVWNWGRRQLYSALFCRK